jgi:hypothetical protein
MNLDELGRTVNPARGVTSVVLTHYQKILAARRMLWDWETISEAMEMAGKSAQIRQAFSRLTEQLKNKEVALPSSSVIDTSGKKPAVRPSPAPAQGTTQKQGVVDWEALAKGNKDEASDIQWKG